MSASEKRDETAEAAPQTLPEFMAQALMMEREAVDRYTEFADALETHNNKEVAALFRTMAGYEAKHAERIMAEMGWTEAPVVKRHALFGPGLEGAETAPFDEVHYLMQPWHALQLALAAERRAEAFFAVLARMATNEPVRQAALELQAEEAEHVALVQEWIAKVPPPDPDWAMDPDPPRYTD
jgi:rubrerythrin